MEKLTFQAENGEAVEFYVLEQTRVNGKNYLLVSEDENGECLILQDHSREDEKDSLYEIVEDEEEQNALLSVFEQLL